MNPTELERLERMWEPRVQHPSKPSVREHYAEMRQRFVGWALFRIARSDVGSEERALTMRALAALRTEAK